MTSSPEGRVEENAMLTRDQLHRLIDTLSDEQLGEIGVATERLIPPALLAALRAPLDDEPETAEERAAVAEANEDIRAGRVVSHEELRRELGW